jgi:condensin complex subunit 1
MKEWFCMAKQVVNTIYALAEHPDMLCNDMIKRLTIRAFDRLKNTSEEETNEGGKEEDKDESGSVMEETHPWKYFNNQRRHIMMDATQPLAMQAPTQED